MNKVAKFDFDKTINFFWKSPSKWKLVLYWGSLFLVPFVVMGIFYMLMAGILILMGGDPADMDQSMEIIGPIIGFLFCFIYILMLLGMYGLQFYMMGAPVKSYGILAKNFRAGKETKIEELMQLNIKENLIYGLKMFVVTLVYLLPIILMFFILMAVGIPISIFLEESGGEIFSVLLMCVFFVLYLTTMAYGVFINLVLTQIFLERAELYGFRSLLDFKAVFSTFNKNRNFYFKNALFILVPLGIWFLIYFITIPFVYLCIGLFILPFVIGLIGIIQVYIIPYILTYSLYGKE